MKRIAKVLNKDAVIPELKYIVFTPGHAIVWNGTVGIRFKLQKQAGLLDQLIRQHGTFAIVDGLRFMQIISTLEKISKLDIRDSHLVMTASSGKATVKIPVVDKLPKGIPHLDIDWELNGKTAKVDGLWHDAADMISRDGVALWGDVVGVYDTDAYDAAFDYGVLLYNGKKKYSRTSRRRKSSDESLFCPYYLLDLGLAGIHEAVSGDDGLLLRGEDVEYFTHIDTSTHVLDSMLAMREEAVQAKQQSITLDFNASVWKRAKVFNRLVVTLVIHGGNVILKSDTWDEHIGITDAPDNLFITRVSLLERWTIGTLGHKLYLSDNGWYLYGTTRKGSEFFGNLTAVATPDVDEGEEYTIPELGNEGAEDEDAGSLFSL